MTDEMTEVLVAGGVLDGGAVLLPTEMLRDWTAFDIEAFTDAVSWPELYVMRWLQGEDKGDPGSWWAVWAPLFQKARDEQEQRGPDAASVKRMQANHGAAGFSMLEPCPAGEHDWTPWAETRGGNHTRHCTKCQLGQSRIRF